MRFILLALFFSTFHCNIDGLLFTSKGDKIVNASKTKKSSKRKKGISFYDNTNVGQVLDELDGVKVYFNGPITNVNGRNTTPDGYNLGLKYQCVEFVKRYYYEHYNHKMPNSYGHAKEFYNKDLGGRGFNKERGLQQYANGGKSMPMKGDLVVFGGKDTNIFGHVGIISKVRNDHIEIIQQNVAKHTRAQYGLKHHNGHYYIDDADILGWLRH